LPIDLPGKKQSAFKSSTPFAARKFIDKYFGEHFSGNLCILISGLITSGSRGREDRILQGADESYPLRDYFHPAQIDLI
jgi:hypothetical protein